MRLINILQLLLISLCLFSSCKKTSEGEIVAIWENVYKVEVVEFERDFFSGRLIEKVDTKEFTASDDIAAAEEGFIWYLVKIKVFCKLNKSSNGNWISIPKFYSVYNEDGHLVPRIKGDAKQNLIKTVLSDEYIQTYKENLPPYHFEYSALMCD